MTPNFLHYSASSCVCRLPKGARETSTWKAIASCNGPRRYSKSSHQLHEPPRRKVLRGATLYTLFLVASRGLAACSLPSVFWLRDSGDKLQVYHQPPFAPSLEACVRGREEWLGLRSIRVLAAPQSLSQCQRPSSQAVSVGTKM